MNKDINPLWLSLGGVAVVFWIAVLFPGEKGFFLAFISTIGGIAIPVGLVWWLIRLIKKKPNTKKNDERE